MLWLVETDFASTGKPDLGHRTPPCFFHLGTPDVLFAECRYLALQIVTHQIEFVPNSLLGRMNGHLCRRQREDQPTVASVRRRKAEDLPEEGAISRRILLYTITWAPKIMNLLPLLA